MRVRSVRYDANGWGTGEVWLEGGRLVWHELPNPVVRARAVSYKEQERGGVVVARLQAYFAGERVGFDDLEIDLDWCTPFQSAVAEALRAVPYGEAVTYGELAALAGYPNAHRAAGSFCARNRLPLVLPCHRVVAAGSIGSYGSLGIDYKRRLLALEGVAL